MPANVSWKIGDTITTTKGERGKQGGGSYYNEETNQNEKHPVTYEYPIYKWNGKNWIDTGNFERKTRASGFSAGTSSGEQTHFTDINSVPVDMGASKSDWGAADISAKDFIDPRTGEQLPLYQVAQKLDPKLPNITGDELMQQIKDMAPKYQAVAQQEKEQKGYAMEARDKDIYGISKDARGAAKQMRGAYASGMGAGIRGAVTAEKDVSQSFKQAQQAYGKDIYGIEQKAAGAYETEIGKFVDEKWLETPEGGAAKISGADYWKPYEDDYKKEQAGGMSWDEMSEKASDLGGNIWGGITNFFEEGLSNINWGKEGGYVHKDGSGVGNNRRKTFLDLMTSLPDAGGS